MGGITVKSNVKWATTTVVLMAMTIAFIFFNSCQNADASWQLSNATGSFFGPILHVLHDLAVALFGWTGNEMIIDYGAFVRKLAHFLEYAALGAECALFCVFVKGKCLSNLLWMAVFVPLFTAVIDEFIQSFFERTSSVSDVLLDFTGACCGILFMLAVTALILHSRKNNIL